MSLKTRRICLFGLLLGTLFLSVAWGIRRIEEQAKRELNARFHVRVEVAERFLQAYTSDLLRRERRLAAQDLAAPHVNTADFERVVRSFGFEAAVLLDGIGTALQVFPSRPDLIGRDLASRYLHLRNGLERGEAISSVVSSAAAGAPVVAFAARYRADGGVRVLSGAYDVKQTPLHAYVAHLISLPSATTDLVDDKGVLIASSRPYTARQLLADVDPALAQALALQSSGICEGARGDRLFVARIVHGAPWRLVAALDQRVLHSPLQGPRRWAYWTLFAAFCAAAGACALLMLRLFDSREHLRLANADLARLARIDRLTDLANRMHIEEQLARLQSASQRQRQPLSVLMIDVDHFKRINDAHGHAAGDLVLRAVASQMVTALRAEDVVGRWGGEEFVALLPNTAHDRALGVAERLRLAVRAPIKISPSVVLEVSVSIGCATSEGWVTAGLLGGADEALYRAKERGRNRVESHPPLGQM